MKEKTDGERSLFPFVLGGFLLCLLFFVIGALFLLSQLRATSAQSEEGIAVPALVGGTLDSTTLPESLTPHLSYQFDATLPEGTILAQAPAAGVRCRHGSELDLTISTRRKGVKLPDVVGMQKTDAMEILALLDIPCTIENEVREDLPSGTVLATRPRAGERVFSAEGVTLVICKNETIHVPNVVGMPLDQAILTLESANLSIGTITRTPHVIARGTVLSQSITERAPTGTKVNLVVAD